MNISKYRAFLKVAATRSFSQAADQLHCTQSAASRMILDLSSDIETNPPNDIKTDPPFSAVKRGFWRQAVA